MDDDTKRILSIGFLVMGCGVFYYFAMFLPNNAKQKLEMEQARIDFAVSEKERAKNLLETCFAYAQDNYSSMWDNECENLNLKKDCFLPVYKVTRLDALRQKDRDDCFKQYPQ